MSLPGFGVIRGNFNWTMRNLSLAAILAAMLSCGDKSNNKDLVEYSDGRQLLTVNNISRDGSDFKEPKIQKITPTIFTSS